MSKKTGLPKYVSLDWHASGTMKLVFRRGGKKRVLPGPPESKAFWAAYAAAMAGEPLAAPKDKVGTVVKGSLGEMCELYFQSAAFRADDELTQSDKRGVLKSIQREPIAPGKPLTFDTCPLKVLTRKHVAILRDRKAGFPNAANKRLRYLNVLFRWALDAGHVTVNPAADVAKVRVPKGGFHTWTVEELRQFEATHAVGSTARLALGLLGFAGLRRSDACRAGRQHVQKIDGRPWLILPQHKNRKRQGKVLEIPILPELAALIDATPRTDLPFLTTEYGRAFSIKGFGGRMKKWCEEASLPRCSAHGVRKAAATIAIDNGATDAQLMAIFGWETAKEVLTYTKQRNRRRLAGEGIELLKPRETPAETGNKIVPREDAKRKPGTKSRET
jgi:integrase